MTQNKKVKNAFYLKLDGSQRSLFLMGLFNEIMLVKERWMEREDILPKYLKDLDGRKNPKSSFLNRMLCEREAQFLQKVIQHLLTEDEILNKEKKEKAKLDYEPRCIIPMFDGFLIEGKISDAKLETINKLTQSEIKENHSIRWIKKPVIDDADIPYNYIEEVMENCELYQYKKPEYERTRCFIKKSGSYQVQYKDKDGAMTWIHYPKNQMEEDGANQLCYVCEDGNQSNMFREWRRDKDRRQYEDIDFIPYNPAEEEGLTCSHVFNTFEGMNFKLDSSYNEVDVDIDLKEYLLNTLGGGNEEVYNFLYNVLAQIIQKPREKTGICVILTGEEGVGKDTIIYLIRKLLGSNYVVATNIMEDIVPKRGQFNMKLKDKIVVEFNETTGKDGNEYIEQLKDFITREENDIRELYKAPYKQNNMVRLFVFGNGLNPISMVSGQRRFIWIKVPSDRKGDTEYWNNLYSKFDNEEWIDKIGNELLHRDYGTYFEDKNYPITDIMEKYYKLNMAKEVKFLWTKIVEKDSWGGSNKIIQNKKTGMVYIETKKLYSMFHDYCDENSLPLTWDGKAWSSTHFTKMILDYDGVEDSKMRCFKFKDKKTTKRMYGFDREKLKESMMKKHNFIGEEEEELIELDGNCFIPDSEDELDKHC